MGVASRTATDLDFICLSFLIMSARNIEFISLSLTIASESDSDQSLGVESHDMDPLSDTYSPDDQLNPLEKLEKYFQSEEAIER